MGVGCVCGNGMVAVTYNVLALGAVADFGAKNCQVTTKADAMHNAELTTKTAIEPNACYKQPFIQIINLTTTICQEK